MEQIRILIVEDEQVVALDLQASLEGLAYAVVGRVATGEAAIAKAQALRPHLVLMDIKLAGPMDGIAAAEVIRQQLDVPVIFLTAFSDEATLRRAQVSEPFGYILKPFQDRELYSNIEMALYRHRLERQLRESEHKYRSVFDEASDGLVLVDRAGEVVEWNQSAEAITGLTRVDALGRPIWDILFELKPVEQRSTAGYLQVRDAFRELLGGAVEDLELHDADIERRDGARRTVQNRSFRVKGVAGLAAGAALRDITERKRAEAAERDQRRLAEALRDTAMALNSTLDSTEVFERILGNLGRVVPGDAATLMLIEGEMARYVSHRGYAERGVAALLDQTVRRVADYPTLAYMLATKAPCVIPDVLADERWMRVPEGDWIRSYLGVPVCIKGQVTGFLNLDSATPHAFCQAHAASLEGFLDQAALAIENARLYERAHQLSLTDDLTGLHNRRHFFDLAETELARCRRYHHPVAAIMMDIDHFKDVNDTYGHLVGDAVLQQVARRLLSRLRAVDILARYGGEEFVALLPETSQEKALIAAQRLCSGVAESPMAAGEVSVHITLSLGVALVRPHGMDLDGLLRNADNALYQAKATGRNRVMVQAAEGA